MCERATGAESAADGDPTRSTSVTRLTLSFLAGIVATVLSTVLLAAVQPWLLPLGAVAGAAVAGYSARVGRLAGPRPARPPA